MAAGFSSMYGGSNQQYGPTRADYNSNAGFSSMYGPFSTTNASYNPRQSVLGASTSTPYQAPVTQKPAGTVLGASTVQPPQQPQQQSVQTPDLGGMIRDGISNLQSQFDSGRADLEGQVGNLYNTQVQDINNQKSQALAKFPGYQEEVATNQRKTLADLASDVRNNYMAANTYLGTRGAGDSSGADMYSYALQSQANKNRAGVQTEYAGQYKQLQDQQIDIESQATNAVNQADQWLASQKAQIAQQYQSMKQQLASQGFNMSFQQAQDFTNYLRQKESEATAYKQQILQGFQSRVEALNNAKLQMSNSSKFDPTQVASGELNATAQYAPSASDYAYSFYPQLKKQNQATL